MTVTVEDGTIVTGADSYVDETALTAYATARGITLATDATVLLYKAMDYLESFDGQFKGERTARDQPVSWPRSGAIIEGWHWNNAEIPRQVISAQLTLALEIEAGEDPNNPSAAVLPAVRKKVEGAVEIQYANPSQVLKVSKTQASRAIISTLLRRGGFMAVRA